MRPHLDPPSNRPVRLYRTRGKRRAQRARRPVETLFAGDLAPWRVVIGAR